VPRRRRLSSTAWKSALRDSPPVFGALRQGMNALVAITISSRRAKSRSARPVISSEVPAE
jgi:hypothetical protein